MNQCVDFQKNQMKNVVLVLAFVFAAKSQAQTLFKDTRIVHGVTYKASFNSPEKVVYIKQDNFDFILVADSFSIEVMNESQWTDYVEFLVEEEYAFFRNGMYHISEEEQVFNSNKKDEFFDGTYIYHLFGPKDTGQ